MNKKRNVIVYAVFLSALVLLTATVVAVSYFSTQTPAFGFPNEAEWRNYFACNVNGYQNTGSSYKFQVKDLDSAYNPISLELQGDKIVTNQAGNAYIFEDVQIKGNQVMTFLFTHDASGKELAEFLVVANCHGSIWVREYSEWKEVINLETTNWAHASVDARNFCPVDKKLWDYRGMVVDFLFSEEESIRVEYRLENRAHISLSPEILEHSDSVKTMFNGFSLTEGDVLTLYLANEETINVALCNGALWTNQN